MNKEIKVRFIKKNIDAHWLYLEKNTEKLPTEEASLYQQINLPHTWNAIDLITLKEYRKASSWDRKYLNFTKKNLHSFWNCWIRSESIY